MRSRFAPVALAPLCLIGSAFSQSQPGARERIALSCACTDSTGRAFAGALRETLAHNPRYREADWQPEVDTAAVRFSIVSLSLDDDSHQQSQTTALSVVFLRNGVMLDHLIETCNRSAVEVCARTTVAAFDSMRSAH